ncbi:methyltransferase domain-containing protein [Sphingomonas sp. G124]|jgi:ubiquinone/menaquinone biosynthesis C-methylase UbiE|uniref:Methyltransferase domain-containing protein n=1 Tax=Sphingomonas cremea TaxID=2904799 RepID=A0A9X1TZ41_9SPHN|nr:class I SAM-dependent methyltransferase [Sphingomonas cremea]MCF2515467.1 methyltransferase domain-containing protein [Sphingomonas cremea]
MTATDTLFAGSIPNSYDRLLVPMLFEPYAADVAARAIQFGPRDVLETAAGTGVVTQSLHHALPDARIVATDLNPAMLEVAAEHLQSDKVHYRAVDAQDLPFDDESFDLIVCQFGVMFYPDKQAANQEAFRVLRPGGRYLLVIWDSLDMNAASKAIHEAVAAEFPDDPPAFLARMPFGYADLEIITADLTAAGFDDIEFETIGHRSRLPSALDAATGMCQGSPLRSEIEARDPAALDRVTKAAAKALAKFEGPDGLDAPMSAHLVIATK